MLLAISCSNVATGGGRGGGTRSDGEGGGVGNSGVGGNSAEGGAPGADGEGVESTVWVFSKNRPISLRNSLS